MIVRDSIAYNICGRPRHNAFFIVRFRTGQSVTSVARALMRERVFRVIDHQIPNQVRAQLKEDLGDET